MCLTWLCPTASALKKDLQSNTGAVQLTRMVSNASHCLHATHHLHFHLFGVLIYSKANMWICGGFLPCVQWHFPWYSITPGLIWKHPQRGIPGIPHRKASIPRTKWKVTFPNPGPVLGSHPTCVYLTALLPSVQSWKWEGSTATTVGLRKKTEEKRQISQMKQ